MIDPHGELTDVIADVPELSADEVERRIGASERARRRRAAAVPTGRIRVAPANRRVVLWRDSATILIFVILALLAARFLLPGNRGIALATETPGTSAILVGSLPAQTGLNFSAPPTLGNVVNPSLGLDATPTPVPIITLGPPTPTPVATPTLGPGATPKPTVKPTPKPTVKPSPTPTPPPAAPIAGFTNPCPTTVNSTVTFTNASSGPIDTYSWDFGDGVGTSTVASPQYAYSAIGTYTVKLTVTGPGGSDSQSASCDVN
jgi:hypothetical protein